VQRNLRTLRDDGFYLAVPAAGFEVAHPPDARRAVLGPSPSPADLVALVRAVLSPPTAQRR
jgi:hypothetical protein